MNNKLHALEKKLDTIEQHMHLQTIFMDTEDQYIRVKDEISEIMAYKTKGAILNCKADWTQWGRKAHRVLSREGKSQFWQKSLVCIKGGRHKIYAAITYSPGRDEVFSDPLYFQGNGITT